MNAELINDPDWRQFEKAVAAFVAALDPTASVNHDAYLPDRHHGGRRQRDVWVSAMFGGHLPMTFLVSCKRYKRLLHSTDIDHFNGEFLSSRANMGVIYSYSGFNEEAIKKAKELGIACCRLFTGSGPEIPAALSMLWYCCASQIALQFHSDITTDLGLATWQDLFDLQLPNTAAESTLLDALIVKFHEAERSAVEASPSTGLIPQAFSAGFEIRSEQGKAILCIVAQGNWKFYRARLEAYEVNGSYEFTSGNFKGSIASPVIDRLSTEPGPGWERLDSPPTPPSSPQMQGCFGLAILHRGNAKAALIEALASQPLTNALTASRRVTDTELLTWAPTG